MTQVKKQRHHHLKKAVVNFMYGVDT